ncbi:MAG TPA: hypothetical protein VGG74_25850 [Kofleriaceae bacterium]
MRFRLALVVMLVGCASKAEHRNVPAPAISDASGDRAIAPVHTLVTPLPAGCERTNGDAVINAKTQERGQYIEIRCEAGDKDVFVDIEIDTEVFPTFDAYAAKRLRGPTHTGGKVDTLADGWLAVSDIPDNPNVMVESQRMIAGYPVRCTALAKPSEAARVVAICKAISAPK